MPPARAPAPLVRPHLWDPALGYHPRWTENRALKHHLLGGAKQLWQGRQQASRDGTCMPTKQRVIIRRMVDCPCSLSQDVHSQLAAAAASCFCTMHMASSLQETLAPLTDEHRVPRISCEVSFGDAYCPSRESIMPVSRKQRVLRDQPKLEVGSGVWHAHGRSCWPLRGPIPHQRFFRIKAKNICFTGPV